MRTVQPLIDEALGCEVVGAIYASVNTADLSEDMLEVVLPDSTQVCAGWSSIDSAYRITATHGLAHVRAPYFTKDPHEATSVVEQWVAELAAQHSAAEIDKRVTPRK
ncbi:MAG: hypothetical protein WD894_20905 [Pirellulales bacterium]